MLCFGRYDIVYIAEHWFPRVLGFLLNELYNNTFDSIFQPKTALFSLVKEMGNGKIVTGAVFKVKNSPDIQRKTDISIAMICFMVV